MKKIAVFCIFILILSACRETPKSYVIRGNINSDALNGSMVYLAEIKNKKLYDIDSTRVEEQMFLFQGSTDTTSICVLRVKKRPKNLDPIVFVLENGNILIHVDSLANISGTPLNNALQKYYTQRNQYNAELSSIQKEYRDLVEQGGMDITKETFYKERFDNICAEMKSKTISFVRNNVNNLIGGYVFGCYPHEFSDAEKSDILANAAPEFYSNPEIEDIKLKLENRKTIQPGTKITDLNLKDIQGTPVKLSQIAGNGQYALINFWASWSEPSCKYALGLRPVYYRFRRQGFNIVGVSLDTDSAAWATSTRSLWLPWSHVSDLKGWQSEAATTYGLSMIPQSLLIAPDGTIESVNLTPEELTNKLNRIYFPYSYPDTIK